MTPEDPKAPEPKRPQGRPKRPDYSTMHPVYELYVRVRDRMRKTKPVTAPEIKGWLIEIALLQAEGFDVRIREPETPEPEKVIALLQAKEAESPKQEQPQAATPAIVPAPTETISFGGDL